MVDNDYGDLGEEAKLIMVFQMLAEATEEDLMKLPARCLPPIYWWMTKNILEEKVMPVTSWLSTAFHLQKQRWDSSIDWLELQPMSKILLMIDIQSKFGEEQERQAKKAGKK